MKSKKIFCLFIVMLFAVTGAYAESPAPVTLTVQDVECDISKNRVAVGISVDNPGSIVGAAFTVKYDIKHLTLKSVDSDFFGSFENQFQEAGALNPAPADVTVDGTTYSRPLVVGDEDPAIGGTMIAAVRLKPAEAEGTHTLFTLNFEVANLEPGAEYPVEIVPSVIKSEEAGYSPEGEEIPMLVGYVETEVVSEKLPTIPVAQINHGQIIPVDYPKTLVSGVLRVDGKAVPNTRIEIYSALENQFWTTTTDRDGYFEVTVLESAAAEDLELSFNSPDYGRFGTNFSVLDGNIQAGFANTAPEMPVIVIEEEDNVVVAPTGLTPAFETEQFSDENNGHGETQWQIANKTKLDEQFLDFEDIINDDGSIVEDYEAYLVYEARNNIDLTLLTVPEYVLDKNTQYYVRARFYDNCTAGPMASPWSEYVVFKTEEIPTGFKLTSGVLVPEEQALSEEEMAFFDEGVIGVKSAGKAGGETINLGITQPDNAEIGCLSTRAVDDLGLAAKDAMPEHLELPYGVVGFNLNLDDPDEGVVRVTINFDQAIPEGMTWWKYNEAENSWIDYTEHAEFAEDRMSVELEIEDGGFGDFDGVKNGRIVDPGGVGPINVEEGEEGEEGEADSESSGGGGSCFIRISSHNSVGEAPGSENRFAYILGALLLVSGLAYRRIN